MAGDAAGKRWLLPDEVAIPQSGEITVTATAEETRGCRSKKDASPMSSPPWWRARVRSSPSGELIKHFTVPVRI